MGARRKTRGEDKRRIANLDQRLQALELRRQRYTLRQIADAMGLSGPQQASNLLEGAFKDIQSPKVDELRNEVDQRCQVMLEQLMPVVIEPEKPLIDRLMAMDRIIKVDRELRKMHGVDAPVRTEVTGKDGGALKLDVTSLTDEQLESIARGDLAGLAGESGDGAPPSGGNEDDGELAD